MEIELVNRISNLTFSAYYSESLDMIIAHFFNKVENKPDIIAYLKPEYWDVREIVNEVSELNSGTDGFYSETVTISHEHLGNHLLESRFDKFIRMAIKRMAQNEDVSLIDDRVLEILSKE